VRARAAEFLGRHLVLDGRRPAQRATDAILERLGGLAH
jgi:hypothetical protein